MNPQEFAVALQHLPKRKRWAAVQTQLESMLARDTSADDQIALLRQVCRIGKNYERMVLDSLGVWIQSMEPSTVQHLSQFLSDQRRVPFEITDRQAGAHLGDLKNLLMRLEQLPKKPACDLDVQFNTQYAYVYGLCAIAAWATQNARALRVDALHDRVTYFLERAGFLAAWKDRDSDPVNFDTDTIFGFTRIDAGVRFPTDTHASRLVDLFRKNMSLDDQVAVSLSTCFAELIENTVKHGEIRHAAWLFANYHPKPKIMHVCICDRGMGIRETFLQSGNPRLMRMAHSGRDWIKEASELFVTSKSHDHSGYGLYVTRELIRRNGGTFVIMSGDAGFSLRPRTPESMTADVEEFASLETPWKGTLLGLQFRLDRQLRIGDVYDSFPTPDGDPDLDLFDD